MSQRRLCDISTLLLDGSAPIDCAKPYSIDEDPLVLERFGRSGMSLDPLSTWANRFQSSICANMVYCTATYRENRTSGGATWVWHGFNLRLPREETISSNSTHPTNKFNPLSDPGTTKKAMLYEWDWRRVTEEDLRYNLWSSKTRNPDGWISCNFRKTLNRMGFK